MEKFKEKDKVIIKSVDNIFNNKMGYIISLDEENNLATVKVILDEEKNYVIQYIDISQLEKISNENLVEAKNNEISEDDFENLYIGKKCIFNGFDYDDIYNKIEDENGSYIFSDEDQDEIDYYESLRKVPCSIVGCSIIDGFDPDESNKENFKNCYWDIYFDNGDEISAVSGDCLTLVDKVNESYNKKDLKDYIKDYVYALDIDDSRVPSWMFLDKIAASENKKSRSVFEDAKELKYNLYSITGDNGFNRLIVAAPECSDKNIIEDYGDFVLGTNVEIRKLK